MDIEDGTKVNWITAQEQERLLHLLDCTPDLDNVLLALRSRLRGSNVGNSSRSGCILYLLKFFHLLTDR